MDLTTDFSSVFSFFSSYSCQLLDTTQFMSLFPVEEHFSIPSWRVLAIKMKAAKKKKKNPCVQLVKTPECDCSAVLSSERLWLFPQQLCHGVPVSHGGELLWLHSICGLSIWIHDPNMPPCPTHQQTPSAQLESTNQAQSLFTVSTVTSLNPAICPVTWFRQKPPSCPQLASS